MCTGLTRAERKTAWVALNAGVICLLVETALACQMIIWEACIVARMSLGAR
jgi:hypothetical protein